MKKIATLGLPALTALSLTVAGAALAQTSTSPSTTPSTPPAATVPPSATTPSTSTSPAAKSAATHDGASLTLTDEQAVNSPRAARARVDAKRMVESLMLNMSMIRISAADGKT